MRSILILIVATGVAAIAASLPTQSGVPSPALKRGHLIVMREEALSVQAGLSLGDLLSARLPLVVARGRFHSSDGPTSVCLVTRRDAAKVVDGDRPVNRPQPCPSIPVFVDGVRVRKAGEYVSAFQVTSFESAELVSGAKQTARYGHAAEDVLVIWTRGHGPHAKSVN